MDAGIEFRVEPSIKRRSVFERLKVIAAVAANPVVVRDLRAQMRGTKSYWYMGAYLLLLGILTVTAYAQCTGYTLFGTPQNGNAPWHPHSIMEAQGIMQGFYYYLFLTLAALICLIAPALTAASIVGERQRQSFDLLVTTPLTAAELLVGKLISSVAFIGLLLALSLPASALCILFGGATVGDVFRIYGVMALDGIVLASIGLYFSCACRANLIALVWSYVATAAFLCITALAYVGVFATASSSSITVPPHLTALLGIAALNPFAAVLPAVGSSIDVGLLHVPVLIVTILGAFLWVRLMVTASAYRVGAYGAENGTSLRRQILAGLFLLAFCAYYSILVAWKASTALAHSPMDPAEVNTGQAILLLVVFLAGTPFLAGLFVPARMEDAPSGVAQAESDLAAGGYDPQSAFRLVHRGSLPYFHLLILATVVATGLATWAAFGSVSASAETLLACTLVFVAGLGLVYWAVSWFFATVVSGISRVRALAFGTFVGLLFLPMLPISLTAGDGPWSQNPLATAWLLYPLLACDWNGSAYRVANASTWMLLGAGQALCWAVPFIAVAVWRERRPEAASLVAATE